MCQIPDYMQSITIAARPYRFDWTTYLDSNGIRMAAESANATPVVSAPRECA